MVEPIRISCTSVNDVPSCNRIASLAAEGRHVVLQFPIGTTHDQKSKIIANLVGSLPEFSVFDSGGNAESEWVTAVPVISSQIIHANRTKIEIALTAYRAECSRLMRLFESDTLPSEYSTALHGGHCCFKHVKTGQTIEAPLQGFARETVDPYFFALFVKSTPEFSDVAALIRHEFHDAAQMLKILEGSV